MNLGDRGYVQGGGTGQLGEGWKSVLLFLMGNVSRGKQDFWNSLLRKVLANWDRKKNLLEIEI